MAIETIIMLVLVILGALMVFKVTKSILKAVFLAVSVILLIVIIGGYFVVSDANDFREKFPSQPSIYLLKDDEKIIAGFSGILEENFTPSPALEEQINSYQYDYEQKNLNKILGENYKLFIMNKSAFDFVNEVSAGEKPLAKQEIFDLLDSSMPINDYLSKQGIPDSQKSKARQDLLAQMNIKDDTEFKGILFGLLYATAMSKEGPLFMFDQVRNENMIVYPETAMFKLLKQIPSSFIQNIATKIKKGEEKSQ